MAALFLSGLRFSGACARVLPSFMGFTADWISSELITRLRSGIAMMLAGGFQPFLAEDAVAAVP